MNYYVIICTAFIVLTFLAANIVAWLIFYHAYQVYSTQWWFKQIGGIKIYICAKGILSTVRSSAAHFKQREFSSRQVEEMSRQFGFNLHKAKQVYSYIYKQIDGESKN